MFTNSSRVLRGTKHQNHYEHVTCFMVGLHGLLKSRTLELQYLPGSKRTVREISCILIPLLAILPTASTYSCACFQLRHGPVIRDRPVCLPALYENQVLALTLSSMWHDTTGCLGSYRKTYIWMCEDTNEVSQCSEILLLHNRQGDVACSMLLTQIGITMHLYRHRIKNTIS